MVCFHSAYLIKEEKVFSAQVISIGLKVKYDWMDEILFMCLQCVCVCVCVCVREREHARAPLSALLLALHRSLAVLQPRPLS